MITATVNGAANVEPRAPHQDTPPNRQGGPPGNRTVPTHAKDPITRDQLLEALDTEISSLTSDRSAAGWTYWAILGALAALIWLGIDTIEKHQFAFWNVVLLTLALSLIQTILRYMGSSLDVPPVIANTSGTRFRPISRLMAMTRSVLFFHLLEGSFFLAASMILSPPFRWMVLFYLGSSLVACTIALVISYVDFPGLPTTFQKGFNRSGPVSTILLFLFLLLGSFPIFYMVWVRRFQLTTHDLRLALLAAAFLYLVKLALENRASTSRLTAFRTIRQDLAFARISLEEAETQSDLLLIGGTLAQILRPKYDELLAEFEKVRVTISQTRDFYLVLGRKVEELRPYIGFLSKEKQRGLVTALDECDHLTSRALENLDKLQEKYKKFLKAHLYLVTLAPESAKDGDGLLNSIKCAIEVRQNESGKLSEESKTVCKAARELLRCAPSAVTAPSQNAQIHSNYA